MRNRERELGQPPDIEVASEAFREHFATEVDALIAHKQEKGAFCPMEFGRKP